MKESEFFLFRLSNCKQLVVEASFPHPLSFAPDALGLVSSFIHLSLDTLTPGYIYSSSSSIEDSNQSAVDDESKVKDDAD